MSDDLLDEVLRQVVLDTTGHDYGPRPGQKALAHDILNAMNSQGRVAAIGPTGLGKSFALLAPAMLTAVLAGERSLISTESLALQAQYAQAGGDCEAIANAVEKVTGTKPTFAVHKGWANRACHLAAHNTANIITGGKLKTPEPNQFSSEPALNALDEARDALTRYSRPILEVDGVRVGDGFRDLTVWCLDTTGGDKASWEGDVTAAEWGLLSTTPAECAKTQCPFWTTCIPNKARKEAAEADVVITNHHLLGIQAATAAPVLVGNKKLGTFHHLLIDEAHGLPSIVRSSGATDISARRIRRVTDQVAGVLDMTDKQAQDMIKEGRNLADLVERQLDLIPGVTLNSPAEFIPEEYPTLTETLLDVTAWCDMLKTVLPPIAGADLGGFLKLSRARSRVTDLADDIRAATTNNNLTPLARWVEDSQWGRSFKTSPVDVAPNIASLFTTTIEEEDETTGELVKRELRLSVTMASATLPASFTADTGIGARVQEYPSPFDHAYNKSVLFCPALYGEDELSQVAVLNTRGRWVFNTDLHASWCADRIVDLVRANGGSALVLSANRKNGELYAATLRRQLPDMEVFSQWDGRDPRLIVQDWKQSTGSVMVGTRSLMTGVDAKGETCTLVVIDRVPRAAGNVVDDARVTAVSSKLQLDKWSADRFVYVTDAALLLEQALGRLVRSLSDSGMAACLDPRIVPGTALSYNTATAEFYWRAARRFSNRQSRLEVVLPLLEGR